MVELWNAVIWILAIIGGFFVLAAGIGMFCYFWENLTTCRECGKKLYGKS